MRIRDAVAEAHERARGGDAADLAPRRMGEEAVIPGHRAWGPEDADAAERWLDRVAAERERLLFYLSMQLGSMEDMLTEDQFQQLPAVIAMFSRQLTLQYQLTLQPGVRIDLEAAIRSGFANEIRALTAIERDLLEEALADYAREADVIVSRIRRFTDQAIIAELLTMSGQDAVVGGKRYMAADWARVGERPAQLRSQLFEVAERTVLRIFSFGFPGFSYELRDAWIDQTTPASIVRTYVDADRLRTALDEAGLLDEDVVDLIHAAVNTDERGFETMRRMFIDCQQDSARWRTVPFKACPDTCEKLRLARQERIDAWQRVFDGLEGQTLDAACDSIRLEIKAHAEESERVLDWCAYFKP